MPDSTDDSNTLDGILNDPEGEIWLETVDGELLSIRAYFLQAHSGVFRNMLAIPTSDRIKNEQPIPVSASKEDFASLLAYATLDDVEHLSHWPTMGRVYELSEIYDFPAVRGRLIDRINRKKRTAPWETFVFAAQKRMLPLARSALGQMHREKDTLVTNADKIPKGRDPKKQKPSEWWASIAAGFRPRE